MIIKLDTFDIETALHEYLEKKLGVKKLASDKTYVEMYITHKEIEWKKDKNKVLTSKVKKETELTHFPNAQNSEIEIEIYFED